jgi:uncharacterized protein YndB with AHSA1/START domain
MGTTTITAEPGVPFIDVEREFDADRDLVFRAYTDPDLIVQWLGPAKYRMTLERWDVRDGGSWRYVHHDDAGNAWGFHGVFHGDPTPDQLVQTFEFDGAPGHVSLERLSLESRGGRTVVRTHSVFQTVEARDAMLQNGMAEGMNSGFERLDALLGRLTTPVA